MKKQGTLNSSISNVLSEMGHTDTLCVADCGLPIPEGPRRIDISLTAGVPGFVQTLEALAEDMEVEAVVLAEEIRVHNPQVEAAVKALFPKAAVRYVPHEAFKQQTRQCRAVVRTGESTPYANVILQSGVYFR